MLKHLNRSILMGFRNRGISVDTKDILWLAQQLDFQSYLPYLRRQIMTIEIIGAITILIGAISILLDINFAIWSFIGLTLLGSAAAVLLGGSGSIQPAHLFLGFVVVNIAINGGVKSHLIEKSSFPEAGFWLILLVFVGVTSAIFFPRIFQDSSYINPIGSTAEGAAPNLVRLAPTSGNLTQTVYMIADCICFFAISNFIDSQSRFYTVVRALIMYCVLNIIFAFLDLMTGLTGTGFLLDFIRNADYAIHDDEVTGGLRRIVGSFTETSAFSSATIGTLMFTTRLWLGGAGGLSIFIISVVSFMLLVFSTSATAYAALVPAMIYLYSGSVIRLLYRNSPARDLIFVVTMPLMILLVTMYILVDPVISKTISDFLSVAIFDKTASASGLERAQWNIQAMRNFLETYGVGGGLGTIRASSFSLALLSNLGLIGFLCFSIFFFVIFVDSKELFSNEDGSRERNAARAACLGLLISANVSGALVDLGLPFYVFAALASSRVRH